MLEAKAARDAQLAEVKAEISRREERIAYYAKRAALLEDSGCPAPENATCNFLKDAVAAKDSLETLREGLNGYRASAKTEYERLTAAFQQAKAAYTAIGDPAAELEEIAAEEAGHRQLAGLAPKLAAAETLVEELAKTIEAEETRIRETTKAIEEANAALPQYREAHTRAEDARASLNAKKALADTLPQRSVQRLHQQRGQNRRPQRRPHHQRHRHRPRHRHEPALDGLHRERPRYRGRAHRR